MTMKEIMCGVTTMKRSPAFGERSLPGLMRISLVNLRLMVIVIVNNCQSLIMM